jgi:hypothetical protein
MCMSDGKLVVNDFGSFEAAYWGSGEKEFEIGSFLIKFWENTILLMSHSSLKHLLFIK